jgi:phenylalanyl-tRNA synthetase alpha chain
MAAVTPCHRKQTVHYVSQSLENLLQQASAAISQSGDMVALDAVRVAYLGKKGEITAQLKNLGQLPAEERPAAGQAINRVKAQIQELLEARKAALGDAAIASRLASETIDISLPGRRNAAGGLHPVTLTMNRIDKMFGKLGFDIAEGPEVEDDFHNFEALNTSMTECCCALIPRRCKSGSWRTRSRLTA